MPANITSLGQKKDSGILSPIVKNQIENGMGTGSTLRVKRFILEILHDLCIP